MTLDDCLENYEETGNTLFYTYVDQVRVMAEVKWGAGGADYKCYTNFHNEDGPRLEIDDPDVDTWCEF